MHAHILDLTSQCRTALLPNAPSHFPRTEDEAMRQAALLRDVRETIERRIGYAMGGGRDWDQATNSALRVVRDAIGGKLFAMGERE